MLQFDNKTVAVSGAAIGIGNAIARTFVSMGASVFACDIRDAGLADLASKGIAVQRFDLSDRQAAAAWVAAIETQCGGAVDILVNNAGGVAGQTGHPFEEVSDADWDRIFAINVDTAFALSRACVPAMKRARRGCIINMTSGAATQASLTGIQAYCTAKHALLGLTRQLAHELGPYGIRVNSVAPGLVLTNEATRRQWEGFGVERQRAHLEGIALRRLGTVEDVVNVVILLASDLAGFVTGQNLSVDGGR